MQGQDSNQIPQTSSQQVLPQSNFWSFFINHKGKIAILVTILAANISPILAILLGILTYKTPEYIQEYYQMKPKLTTFQFLSKKLIKEPLKLLAMPGIPIAGFLLGAMIVGAYGIAPGILPLLISGGMATAGFFIGKGIENLIENLIWPNNTGNRGSYQRLPESRREQEDQSVALTNSRRTSVLENTRVPASTEPSAPLLEPGTTTGLSHSRGHN